MRPARLYPNSAFLAFAAAPPVVLLAAALASAASAGANDFALDATDYWWTFAAVPAAMLAAWYGLTKRRRAMHALTSPNLAGLLAMRLSPTRPALRMGMLVTAATLLCMALVGPRWGLYREKQQVFGRDVVVALDVSRSMLAADVEPNRLERAKREIWQQLIERGTFAQSNRLALLAFAGTTSLRLPLTTDTLAFRTKLEQLGVGSIPRGGTAIGEAIRAATDLFTKSPKESTRAILLFTDGEDHEGGPVDAAKEAWEKHGIRVYAIGVGDPSSTTGAQVPTSERDHKPLLHQGQIVFSKLSVEPLQQLAAAGAGEYAPVSQFFHIINRIAAMKGEQLSTEERLHHQPRYQWFLAAAVVLLYLETLLGERRAANSGQTLRTWQQETA
ncbi:MAG: VWA domain-containing protein [Planctomycetota bacterium]